LLVKYTVFDYEIQIRAPFAALLSAYTLGRLKKGRTSFQVI